MTDREKLTSRSHAILQRVEQAWYEGLASAPNHHYACAECGRDLWLRYTRLRNPNGAPAVFRMADGRELCEKCFVGAA